VGVGDIDCVGYCFAVAGAGVDGHDGGAGDGEGAGMSNFRKLGFRVAAEKRVERRCEAVKREHRK